MQEDALRFCTEYDTDVQFILSRVQHHWHLKNKEGHRVPMKYCSVKGRRSQKCCKRGFPRKVIRNGKGEVLKYRARIVCKGIARELGFNVSEIILVITHYFFNIDLWLAARFFGGCRLCTSAWEGAYHPWGYC